jgi:hypothetical protein
MNPDYVGYLLGLLDPDERRRTEEHLRADPAAGRHLDRLRAALAPLEADRADEPPPPGLADRTLACVFASANVPPVGEPPAPAWRVSVPGERPVFQPSRWRRADALVAAAILVVVGGLGVSGMGRLTHAREVTACRNNMRQLHLAFVGFSDQNNGRFPQVQDRPPHNHAGAFVPILQGAGLLPPARVPDCPAATAPAANPAAGYAYTLGYRDADGRLHGLSRDAFPDGADLVPILADRAAPPSHRGGHNVLYIGGNVRFTTSPRVGFGRDDIFYNQASEVAAGLHRLDSVLGASDTSP